MLDMPSPVPFDFLINGVFLRTTLDAYLAAAGLSTESVLQLQYVRSMIPPLYQASFQHDDWVSSVDVLSATSSAGHGAGIVAGGERILSGSYDGLLRVWNTSGQCLTTSAGAAGGGHTDGVKVVRYVSASRIASAGLDRTIRIWKQEGSGALKPSLELYGHTGSIDAIAVQSSSNRLLSASTDGSIGLWSISKSSAPPAPLELVTSAPTAKRRKINSSVSTPQRGALTLMAAHTSPATGVMFHPKDTTVAYSCGMDHTLHTHDLVTSKTVDTRTLAHPLLSLTALDDIDNQLLATGTSARHISLLDPRASATTTAVMTLRGHTNKVVTLAKDPENRYGLVSGSHDGTCRVWDVRSVREGKKDEGGGRVCEAVYVVERESNKDATGASKRRVGGDGIKVFDLAWDKNVGIVSSGEDKMVQINKGTGITRPE